jgi:hypothetical protein
MFLHSVSANDKGEDDDEEQSSDDDDYSDDAEEGADDDEDDDDDEAADDDAGVESVVVSVPSEHVTVHANLQQDHIMVNFIGVSSHLAYNYAPALGPYSEFVDVPIRSYELVCYN